MAIEPIKTKYIFRAFEALLNTLVFAPGPFPAVGLDLVSRFDGNPVEAIKQGLTDIRNQHYKAAALVGLSVENPNEVDAAGQPFDTILPVSVIVMISTDGRGKQAEDFEELDDLYDAVMQLITHENMPPSAVVDDTGAAILNYWYTVSASFVGEANWKARRLVYDVQRYHKPDTP